MIAFYCVSYALRSPSYVATTSDCCRGWLRHTRILAAKAASERGANRHPKRLKQIVACRCGDHEQFFLSIRHMLARWSVFHRSAT